MAVKPNAKKVLRAMALKLGFSKEEADRMYPIKVKTPDVGVLVGRVVGIAYEAERGGRVEQYFHEFRKQSQPDFVVSHDGKQLLLIGGKYEFGHRGIEDK